MDWRCILFIVKCLEAYYPESLNVMLIHNGEIPSLSSPRDGKLRSHIRT